MPLWKQKFGPVSNNPYSEVSCQQSQLNTKELSLKLERKAAFKAL